MGLVQLLWSLGYALAAARPADAAHGAALFENFAAGFGTAAFLAFLMSVCERRYAATQFALLSAVYALSRWAAGVASGVLAERLGFAEYFLLTFVLGIPAYGSCPGCAMPASIHERDQPNPRAIAVAASTIRTTSAAWA